MKKVFIFLCILLCFIQGCSDEIIDSDNIYPHSTTLREHTGYLAFGYYLTNPVLDNRIELICKSFTKRKAFNYKPCGVVSPNMEIYMSPQFSQFVMPFNRDERREQFFTIAARMGETGDYEGTTEPCLFPDYPITDIDIVADSDICDGYSKGMSLKNVSFICCASAKQFVESHYSLDNIYESIRSLLSEIQWPISMPFYYYYIEFDDEFLDNLSSGEYPVTVSFTFSNGSVFSAQGKVIK